MIKSHQISSSQSKNQLKKEIQEVTTTFFNNGSTPGLSVIVVKNGELFCIENYGYADIANKFSVTSDTGFAIGSTTKAMTALAVLEMIRKNILMLDEKITQYLPDFTMMDRRFADITIRHLISNMSGLPSSSSDDPTDSSPQALESIIRKLADYSLLFEPGREFHYSNYGFDLAGLIIQRLSGMSFEDYMQKIFQRIGMNQTTMKYWQPSALDHTKGYILNEKNQLTILSTPFDRTHAPSGGSTVSTPNDIAKYLQFLVNDTTEKSGMNILTKSTIDKVFAADEINADNDDFVRAFGMSATYGFGWFRANRQGFLTTEHGGMIGTMGSYFMIDPESKSAVGMLFNQVDLSKIELLVALGKKVFLY